MDTQFLKLAFKILNNYSSYYIAEFYQNQEYLTKEDIIQEFNDYVDQHQLNDQLELEFTSSIAVPAFISHSKRPDQKSKVFVRTPVKYTRRTIRGALNHEIGTHFIRKENNKK